MEGLNTYVLLISSQICTRTSFWYKNIYLFCFGFVLRFGIRIYTVYYLSQKKGNRAITKTKAQRSIHNGIMNLPWRMKH